MAKIFLFMMITVDGYFEGERHDISWHNVDAEFNEFAIDQTRQVGTLLFGRRTYNLMSSYWPTHEARKTDPVVADLMNTIPKIVFSHSMKTLDPIPFWEHVTLKRSLIPNELNALKRDNPKDIAIYGSNNLCVNLIRHRLIDRVRLMINPIAIGKGTSFLAGLETRVNLDPLSFKQFKNGNVLIEYSIRYP